ncbi:hypothetical protein ACFLZV_07420 [Candidatus Margulisiibacteriota bacterium]
MSTLKIIAVNEKNKKVVLNAKGKKPQHRSELSQFMFDIDKFSPPEIPETNEKKNIDKQKPIESPKDKSGKKKKKSYIEKWLKKHKYTKEIKIEKKDTGYEETHFIVKKESISGKRKKKKNRSGIFTSIIIDKEYDIKLLRFPKETIISEKRRKCFAILEINGKTLTFTEPLANYDLSSIIPLENLSGFFEGCKDKESNTQAIELEDSRQTKKIYMLEKPFAGGGFGKIFSSSDKEFVIKVKKLERKKFENPRNLFSEIKNFLQREAQIQMETGRDSKGEIVKVKSFGIRVV